MSKDLISFIVDREQVEAGDTLPFRKALSQLQAMEQAGKLDAYRSIAIAFHGYNDRKEEVWEIPEVRKWVHKLINEIPYLFWYTENDITNTEQTLMLCVNPYEVVEIKGGPILPTNELLDQLEKEGKGVEDLPKYQINIYVHPKSFREMASAIRKFAKQKEQGRRRAEALIEEMTKRYFPQEEE
mgnify:CR=1 FL=1